MARRRRKEVTLALVSDLTPERKNQAGSSLQWPADKRSPQQTARILCPLERLHLRGQIRPRAYEAGVKFRKHHAMAGMMGVIGSVDLHRILGLPTDRESRAFHVQHYKEALVRLGLIRVGVLELVVCYDKPLEEIATEQGRGRGGRGTEAVRRQLESSLEDLANLWGL